MQTQSTRKTEQSPAEIALQLAPVITPAKIAIMGRRPTHREYLDISRDNLRACLALLNIPVGAMPFSPELRGLITDLVTQTAAYVDRLLRDEE